MESQSQLTPEAPATLERACLRQCLLVSHPDHGLGLALQRVGGLGPAEVCMCVRDGRRGERGRRKRGDRRGGESYLVVEVAIAVSVSRTESCQGGALSLAFKN